MPPKLLDDVLQGKVTTEAVLAWMRNPHSEESLALEINFTPAEFAIEVLKTLRVNTSRFFESNLKETSGKRYLTFENRRCEIRPKCRLLTTAERKAAIKEAARLKRHGQPLTEKQKERVTNVRHKLVERLPITEESFPSLKDATTKTSLRNNSGRPKDHRKHGYDGRNKHGDDGHRKHGDDGRNKQGDEGRNKHGDDDHKHGDDDHHKHGDDGHRKHGDDGHRKHGDGSYSRRERSGKKPVPTQISFGSFIVTEKVKNNPHIKEIESTKEVCNMLARTPQRETHNKDVPWCKRKRKGKPPTPTVLLQQRLDLSKSMQKLVITSEEGIAHRHENSIVPDVNLVDNHVALEKLGQIYSTLFELCLIPDLSSELCFVLSLLVVVDSEEMESQEDQASGQNLNIRTLFKTVHNCVHFASFVLNTQRDIVKLLDRATLDFLLQNTTIYQFHPNLYKLLTDLHEERVEAEFTETRLPCFTGDLSSVIFVCENDARPNFPTMESFHAFSKQRDAFYDILKLWEANYLDENWSFVEALYNRIYDLLNLHPEPTNYVHLARLFRGQLVISCVGFIPEETCDASISRFESFKLLHNRFKGYSQHVGPHRPEFPEYQEFFRCFLVTANDDRFFTHLRNDMAAEIRSLSSTIFMPLGLDDRATFVDENSRLNYLRCAASLRILGKFLAFLTFLPYRTKTKLTERIIQTQLNCSSQVPPQPDVLQYIMEAVGTGSLVLAIPWVVQYLALVDEVSLRSDYFRKVMVVILTIYSHIGTHVSKGSDIVIRLSIGWLLESHNIQPGIYLKWRAKQSNNDILAKQNSQLAVSNSSCLDALEMINTRVLYFLCPFLEDFKAVLASGYGPINTEFYKALPVRRASLQSSEELEAAALAKASEEIDEDINEDVFRAYPQSVRNVVRFVAENVASSCIRRHICRVIASDVIDKGVAKMRELGSVAGGEPFDLERYCAEKTMLRCEEEIEDFCFTRCATALPALMAADMLPDIEKMFVTIAGKYALLKVIEWLNLNMTKEFYHTNLQLSLRKKPPGTRIPGTKTSNKVDPLRNVVHLDSAPAPQYTIRALKEMVRHIYCNTCAVDAPRIKTVLEMVSQTVQHRADLIQCAESVIYRQLLSLALQLVCYMPHLMTDSILDCLHELWRMEELKPYYKDLKKFISQRTLLKMKMKERPKDLVWTAMGIYLLSMVKAGLLSKGSLERQYVNCIGGQLTQENRDAIDSCMRFIVDSYRGTSETRADAFKKLDSYIYRK